MTTLMKQPSQITTVVRSKFVFGLIDGLNGAIGLIVSLSVSHAAAKLIVTALLARAGSSAVSMGGAELQTGTDEPLRRRRQVAAMMGGYLTSAVGAGLGYFWSHTAGVIVAIPVTVGCLVTITVARAKAHPELPAWKALRLTLGIFMAAVTLGILASLIAP